MYKASNFHHMLRWPLLGLALIIAATIVLLTTSPSIAHNADLRSGEFDTRPTSNPQPTDEPQVWTPLMKQARDVLALRLSVAPGELAFVSQEAVRWPDTSLGCPEPGAVYAKVLVPGYRFTFSYDGGQYEVHTAGVDGKGSLMQPVSCEGGLAYPA